jgi:hypothetical protein
MEISIEHDLSQEEALKCAKQLLSELSHSQAKFVSKPVQLWDENVCKFSFQAKGSSITGNIFVKPDNILIKAKLPMTLSLFKGIIKETIEKKSREMIAKCKDNL